MVFVGYEQGSKAYRVYDPVTGKLHVSRDVVFDESRGWDWNSTAGVDSSADEMFTVEYLVDTVTVSAETGASSSPTASPAPTPGTPTVEPTTPVPTFVSPPTHIEPGNDLSDEGTPRRYWRVDDCIADTESR